MINSSTNIIIINLDQIHFFENEPSKLEEIKCLAELIAGNEKVFFDTKESYSKFLTLVPIDANQRSRIQQIFKERLGEVANYRHVKLETSIADKNGNKRSIEVPLELLKKKFPYFRGLESFNHLKKGTTENIPIDLSSNSLTQFIQYVYGKEWNITSVEMANEFLNMSEMYLNEHFNQTVMLKVIQFFASSGNEGYFDEIYVEDNPDLFIEEYLKKRGIDTKLSPENRILFTLEDLSKIFLQNQSPKILEFLVKNIPSIEVDIIQEGDVSFLVFLPDYLMQKIAAFGLRVDNNLSAIPFSVYTFLINHYPHLTTYALIPDDFQKIPKTPYEWILYSRYLSYTQKMPPFPFDLMFRNLEEYLKQPKYRIYILKELSRLFVCLVINSRNLSMTALITILEKKVDPNDPLQLIVLGLSYWVHYLNTLSKNNADKSLDYASRVIALNPHELDVLVPYAHLLSCQALELNKTNPSEAHPKFVEAEKWFLEAIKVGVKNPAVFTKLANVLTLQGDYLNKTNPSEAYPKFVEAEKWFLESIKAGVKDSTVFVKLAHVLDCHGNYLNKTNPAEAYPKYAEAEKWLLEAIKAGSKNPAVFAHLAIMLSRQGNYLYKTNPAEAQPKFVETEKWFLEAIKAGEKNPVVFAYLASVLRLQGNYLYKTNPSEAYPKFVEAKKWCLEAIKAGLIGPAVFTDLATVLRFQGEYLNKTNSAEAYPKFVEAEKWFHEAIKAGAKDTLLLNVQKRLSELQYTLKEFLDNNSDDEKRPSPQSKSTPKTNEALKRLRDNDEDDDERFFKKQKFDEKKR